MAETQLYYDLDQVMSSIYGASYIGEPTKTWEELQELYPDIIGDRQPGLYQYDWSDTVKGSFDYHVLSSRWDAKFKAGRRGIMTFKVNRTGTQKILSHIPLHSWFGDITGPLTTQECADEVISKMKAQGVEFWKEPERNGNEFKVYFVTGVGPAAIALVAVAIIGIGILVNWTLDTITCMRIKQDYSDAAIKAAQEIEDPQDRADFLANEAEETEAKSFLDFGLGDTLSGGMKTAIILVGIAVAAVVLIWGVSRS